MTITVLSPMLHFLKQAYKNFYYAFSNFQFIACSVSIQTLIGSKQLQLFHNYTTQIRLAYVSKSRNFSYRTIIKIILSSASL